MCVLPKIQPETVLGIHLRIYIESSRNLLQEKGLQAFQAFCIVMQSDQLLDVLIQLSQVPKGLLEDVLLQSKGTFLHQQTQQGKRRGWCSKLYMLQKPSSLWCAQMAGEPH